MPLLISSRSPIEAAQIVAAASGWANTVSCTGPVLSKGVKRFYRWISLQSISSSSNIFTIQFIPNSGRIRSISSSSNIFTIQFIPNSSRIQSTSSPKPMWVLLFQKHITAFITLICSLQPRDAYTRRPFGGTCCTGWCSPVESDSQGN